MNKKGMVTMYISFIIATLVILMIAAFAAPLGTRFNSEVYLTGQEILAQTNESIQNINDATIRTQVQASIDNAFAAAANNIEVNANIFQYSWIFIIALSGIVVFLFARKIVELKGGNTGFV